MTLLFENPLRIIFIGIVIEAVLGIVLLRTGRGALLWAMLGVLALTLAGVVVERLVVTEKERVEMTLDGITSALEANDLKRRAELHRAGRHSDAEPRGLGHGTHRSAIRPDL